MDKRDSWGTWRDRLSAWQRRLRWLLLLVLLFPGGCTRKFYRNRADGEVAHLLAEKDRYPFWKIENFQVYPDPRARFADPTKPDRPPMPPDDPAAWASAPKPQRPGKAGVARVEGDGYLALLDQWDRANRAQEQGSGARGEGRGARGERRGARGEGREARGEGSGVVQAALISQKGEEGPTLPAPLTSQKTEGEEGPTLPAPRILPAEVPSSSAENGAFRTFLLNMEQAVLLAVLNSREFQSRREDLYLSALPVTAERFSFTAQFFAWETAIREVTGADTAAGPGNRWRFDSTQGFTKLFSTGAMLLAAFANQTVVELTGVAPHTTSQSTINLDVIQPLLRGGGRAVTLEPLTQAERNLLYEIRGYARFRKEFYQAIVAGGDMVPFRYAAIGGGRGVAIGSLSLGTGNPARVGLTPGAAGSISLDGGPAAPTEGYLATLIRRAHLNNEQKNVRSLESFLKLYEALEESGEYSQLQVSDVRLKLLQARSKVLEEQRSLRDKLDNFKLQLGIPVPLHLDLDDGPIRPVTRQMEKFDAIMQQYKKVVTELDQSEAFVEVSLLRGRIRRLLLQSELVKGTVVFRKKMPGQLAGWERLPAKDLENRLGKKRAQVRELLDAKAVAETKGKTWPASEKQRLAELEADLQVGELEKTLRGYEAQPWKKSPGEKERKIMQAARFRDLRNIFSLVLGDASNERLALLRPEWPTLPPMTVAGADLLQLELEEAYDIAIRTALANRLDLMNVRAHVQDSWRQIAIFANSLLGTFLVGYHMDSTTPPGEARPFTFAGSRTRHQLIFNLDLPLVRLPERNSYRASLIAYQRARRALMAAEDFVTHQVRADLRLLRNLAEVFQIQLEAVALAYSQVENSLETLQAPPQPGAGTGGAAAAASLTQQLLGNQSGLLQSQNQLLDTWINYLVMRRQLYLNLELLTLDPRGVWIDDLANQDTIWPACPDDRAPTNPAPAAESGDERPSLGPIRFLPDPPS